MEENFKYHIPEDIPANERTAFHGAAAAAAKAGKKNFNFGGKTHPVTMKKDTAKAIADQKEATYKTNYFTGHGHAKRAGMQVKVHGKGPDGDSVTVSHSNPKKLQKYVDNHLGGGKIKEEVEAMNINEKYRYTVDLYHKNHGTKDSFIKKAKAAGIKGAYSGVNKDGKVKVSLNHHDNSDGGVIHKFLKKHYDKNMTHGNMQTMQTGGPTKTNEDQKESTMSFREKLMSLYESDRAKHYKSAAAAEPMDNNLKGAGAKKMKADIQGNVADKDLEKQSHDDAAKAGRAGPGTKYRSNDNKKGDKKIINPPSDETKKGKAPKVAVESYGVSGNKVSASLLAAVNRVTEKSSMNENVAYHKAMKNAHDEHSAAHESEVTNGGSSDHDYAGNEHGEAANHHQKAIDAHKKHGADSPQYKKAADAAHKQTAMAHETSKDAGKFKRTAKPGIKFPEKPKG